jgi:hypothetical protein
VTFLPLLLLALSGFADLVFALVGMAFARRALQQRIFGLDAAVGIALPFIPFYVVKGAVLVFLGRSFFFGISVVYVTVFLVAPALGAIVLVQSRNSERTFTRSLSLLAVGALALPALGYYATFVEPARLVTERVDVPVPASRLATPLRIAVLADIQSKRVEPHLREAITRAMTFEPHLILLPGDLIQAHGEDYETAIPGFRELLRPLEAPLGVYFVLGNTDDPGRVGRVFEGTNVQLLRNEVAELEHAGQDIRIGGADFYPSAPHVVAFTRTFEFAAGDDLRILLAHYPDVGLQLQRDSRVDLVVAGHTHGGQVQVPLLGPPITLSAVPRRIAAGGLHDLDGRRFYVSRGLGCERGLAPRIRFLAPPEVSLLTLVPE